MLHSLLPKLALGLSLGTIACSRYDLVTTAGGQTYRIDQRTGDVALVTDAGVAPVAVIARDSANPLIAAAANRARYWPVDSLPNIGVKKATLVTRCRGGYLHYRLDIEPIPRRYTEALYQPFAFRFEDDAGFSLAEVPVLRTGVTRVVGRDGRATGLQVIGRVPLSADDCSTMRAWSLLWLF